MDESLGSASFFFVGFDFCNSFLSTFSFLSRLDRGRRPCLFFFLFVRSLFYLRYALVRRPPPVWWARRVDDVLPAELRGGDFPQLCRRCRGAGKKFFFFSMAIQRTEGPQSE